MTPTLGPPPPAFGLMVDHLGEATRAVFAEFSMGLEPCPMPSADDSADQETGMAVIGYAGEGLRGALLLMVEEPAVHSWMDAVGVPDGDVSDTLAEFSNMVLGRLKERLLPIGISIIATTPTAATGRGLRLSDNPGPTSWSAFDGNGWRLRVRLEARFAEGFQPLEGRVLAWQPKAGDVIDFDEPEVRNA
jgi:CheY-specific phosphatase CheX